jgi:hypothetical protein
VNTTETRIKYRGLKDTIKYLKELYTFASRVILKQTVEPIPFHKSKNGFPKGLVPLKKLILGNKEENRAALMILNHYRCFFLTPSTDTSSITEPSK